MLGINFDKAVTNRVTTHVMVWSAKVRRNEQLKRAVMVEPRHQYYLRANFDFKTFIVISTQGIKPLKLQYREACTHYSGNGTKNCNIESLYHYGLQKTTIFVQNCFPVIPWFVELILIDVFAIQKKRNSSQTLSQAQVTVVYQKLGQCYS